MFFCPLKIENFKTSGNALKLFDLLLPTLSIIVESLKEIVFAIECFDRSLRVKVTGTSCIADMSSQCCICRG